MEYSLNEHRHRFAIWTAARAVQRSWTTTANISRVIAAVDLAGIVDRYKTCENQAEFDRLHTLTCEKMAEEFRALGVEATYGRAAKILAVYLKATVIVTMQMDNDQIRLIHPPVDRILLKNLSTVPGLTELRKLNWTKLDKRQYDAMVAKIRGRLNIFDWRLEEKWRPELEKL